MSLVVRIVVSALMLAVLIGQGPVVRPRRARPGVVAGHRRLARRGRRCSPWSASSCRRCGGRRCSTPSRSATRLPRLMSHYLAGQFVSNVLPTTIGGDVLRVSRLSRDTGEIARHVRLGRARAADRLAGAAGHHARRLRSSTPALRHLGSATRVALALAVGTLLAAGRRAGRGGQHQRLGGRFADRRRLAPLRRRRPPRRRPAAPPARRRGQRAASPGSPTSWSWCWPRWPPPRRSGCAPAGLTALLAFFPAVLIAQVLPISHLGPRRARRCVRAVPRPARRRRTKRPIALGLLLYLLNLAVSLLGAPAFAVGGRPSAGPTRRMTATAGPTPTTAAHRRGRTAPSGRRAPACAGGARSSTSSLVYVVYSAVRNQFGSGAGDRRSRARVPPRQGHHPGRSATSRLYFEDRLQQWYLDLPANGLIRLLERLLRRRSTSWSPRVALVWLFRRAPRALPRVAQHAGLHHAAGPHRVRLVLADAAPAARRPRHLRRLPGLRADADETLDGATSAGDPPCDEFGFVDTVAVYGGWASFGSEEMAAVSNQYAAMPSMHIGWSTWCALVLVPLVRRRWAARRWPSPTRCSPCSASWSPPTTTGSTALGGLLCLGVGYRRCRWRRPAPSARSPRHPAPAAARRAGLGRRLGPRQPAAAPQ